MAQFHVYRLDGDMLVLDLQSDLIDTPTRVVAPLLPQTPELPVFTRLEPVFDLLGTRLALHTAEMAAVPARLLKTPHADLTPEYERIRRALDMVFSGF